MKGETVYKNPIVALVAGFILGGLLTFGASVAMKPQNQTTHINTINGNSNTNCSETSNEAKANPNIQYQPSPE
jgi:hypothetical protein